MFKKFTLCCFCLVGSLTGIASVHAQFPAPGPAAQSEPADAATPPVPDEVRITLMARNAIIALSQANLTGNYSVVRDMGTPNFQITNSSARLAEAFATLRSRKIDLAPVMFFNPKFTSAPAFQEGQVLRIAGYFPTSPEQVNFDLAFQKFGEQWMIAGIAVNIAPPGEGPQASAAPESQMAADVQKPGEAKPIKIDLNQPSPPAAKAAAAPKKPAAARKPKSPAQQKTAAAQSPAPAPAAEQPAQPAPAQSQPAPAEQPKSTEFGAGWNPFGR